MLRISVIFFLSVFLANASRAQTNEQTSEQVNQQTSSLKDAAPPLDRYQFSYWSMFTGPSFGNSLDSTTDASGAEVEAGANYFQALAGTYALDANSNIGVQLRASNDLREGGLDLLNPRVFYLRKNVIDNEVFSLGLQGFVEAPTTQVAKQRTQIASFLVAQNFTFKTPNKDLTLFLMTMTNANFYSKTGANRRFELIAMPMITYQISKAFQFMTWAWFDRSNLNGWGDDYWRVGVNYFVLPNVQIYPCVQLFTDQIRANNTTVGLELAAQF